LGKPEQDVASGLVLLPSARRRPTDPCYHSRETPTLAATVGTDGFLDNEQWRSDWLVLRSRGSSGLQQHIEYFTFLQV